VLPSDDVNSVRREAYKAQGNHLYLGILYARAGILDQAEAELIAAGPRAAPLLAYLRSLRPR
jgi:hypothetical protein